ncbi:ribonuclease J [Acanthopleuribacter pedis]|uniref:Ribonuclease J n=1 Tax=Acanthopleuribacter pedis TaxID=442870 RepID=A0A8J7QQ84_9BACT|nr:ribonuclease J [Acanthopleuribacter pedis]MBO1322165.1 ribonuclease J [Acanthopleuribacter pedis]
MSPDPEPESAALRVIPLGGVGEFGANATILQSETTTILVDFGLMFPPDRRQPGVDYYVHDPELIFEQFPELSAVFITHGHEDHIGGLSFLLGYRQLPVYAMPYTLGLIRHALPGPELASNLREVALNEPVRHGDLEVEFIGVTHSIMQACALFVRGPGGTLIHSGDFKVDPLPKDDYPFQSQRLRELGQAGVDLLIMDSTNATKQGFCAGEAEIMPGLAALMTKAPGRVFLTTFSSHMPRVRHLAALAEAHGRRIAFLGNSFNKHFRIAGELDYFNDRDCFVSNNQAQRLPDDEVLYVVTGSQAEARSALMRVASGGFLGVSLRSTDTVVFSSRAIPGNERALALLVSDLERKGVVVHTPRDHHIHTSGHAFREDLAYMLMLTQPKNAAPIHGEYHQLLNHHHWLRDMLPEGEVLLIEDGNEVVIQNGTVRVMGQYDCRLLPIDGNQEWALSRKVLKDRKDMMYSGLLLVNGSISDAGVARFEVQGHGVAEPAVGEITDILEEDLNQMVFDPKMSHSEWSLLVYQRLTASLKPRFSGRPLTKIVINGRVTR